jgi:hypothetical protein
MPVAGFGLRVSGCELRDLVIKMEKLFMEYFLNGDLLQNSRPQQSYFIPEF